MVAPTKRLDVDGVSTGELISTSNTDIDQVIPAGAGSATAETTAVIRGSKGVHVTGGVGDTYSMLYTDTAASSASSQVYLRNNATPTVAANFFGIRSASATMGQIVLSTGLQLQLQNAAGTTIAWATGTLTITNGTKYRCQLQVIKGTTTADGTLVGQIYDDSDTLLRSATTSATNTGTADATTGRCGKVISGSDSVDMDLDEFAFITGTTAEIDAVAANTAPSAGPDQSVDAYALVDLNGSDLESAPTWTQTGGSPTVISPGSANPASYIAPAIRAGTTLTFQISDGVLTDSRTDTVFPHNEFAVVGGVEVPIQIVQA